MKLTVKELVDKTGLEKITASNSVYRGEGGMFYNVDEQTLESIRKLENEIGESLYLIDKGYSALVDIITDNNDDTLEFENFKVYTLLSEGTSGYCCGLVMNAKEVILPPKKTIESGKKIRLYVFRGEDGKLYKMPPLQYPRAVKDFSKWLKRRRIITVKPKYFFNITEDISDWGEWRKKHSVPMWNLDSEEKIKEYVEFLEEDYLPKYQPSQKVVLLKNLIEINVKQGDIDNYISETNNRYVVKR